MFSSGNPETKTDSPQVDTAPHDMINPTALALSLIGWGRFEGQPHERRILSHPRRVSHSIYLQLRKTGDKQMARRVDTA